MNNINVVEDFVSEEDRATVIGMIAQLMATERQALTAIEGVVDQRAVKQGNRYVYVPKAEDAQAIVKKYGEIVEGLLPVPGLMLHKAIFAKMEKGSSIEEHNDFENENDCSDCKFAAVMYLDDQFVGGEIVFPKINERYSPSAGSLVFFPQDDRQFDHYVTRVRSGNRHIMNLCFTSNEDKLEYYH